MVSAGIVRNIAALTHVVELVGVVAASALSTDARARLGSLKVEQAERRPIRRVDHVQALVVFDVAVRLGKQAPVRV